MIRFYSIRRLSRAPRVPPSASDKGSWGPWLWGDYGFSIHAQTQQVPVKASCGATYHTIATYLARGLTSGHELSPSTSSSGGSIPTRPSLRARGRLDVRSLLRAHSRGVAGQGVAARDGGELACGVPWNSDTRSLIIPQSRRLGGHWVLKVGVVVAKEYRPGASGCLPRPLSIARPRAPWPVVVSLLHVSHDIPYRTSVVGGGRRARSASGARASESHGHTRCGRNRCIVCEKE